MSVIRSPSPHASGAGNRDQSTSLHFQGSRFSHLPKGLRGFFKDPWCFGTGRRDCCPVIWWRDQASCPGCIPCNSAPVKQRAKTPEKQCLNLSGVCRKKPQLRYKCRLKQQNTTSCLAKQPWLIYCLLQISGGSNTLIDNWLGSERGSPTAKQRHHCEPVDELHVHRSPSCCVLFGGHHCLAEGPSSSLIVSAPPPF